MKHAREDYNRIQDPARKIPWDEPVFLLRGQDACAPIALEHYADVVERNNGDPEIVRLTRAQALSMKQWQVKNGNKMPDLPSKTETRDDE